jgi:cellulase
MAYTMLVAASALALAGKALGHGYVSGVYANDVYYQGYNPTMQYYPSVPAGVVGWADPSNLGNGPITPDEYTSPDIICHLSATPAQYYAEIPAGGKLTLLWTPWPDSHQ